MTRRAAGTVVKRGRFYSVVIDVGIDPVSGERRRRWHSGYKTRREAEKALAELVTDRNRGEYVSPSKLTLGGFLTNEWLPAIEHSVRPTTLSSYRLHVESYIVPRLGSVLVQRLEPAHLNTLYAELLAGGGANGRPLSGRTVRLTHTTIRKALKDGGRWGRVGRNVADLADPPKPQRPQMKAWAASEVGSFLEYAREHDGPMWAFWRLAATTGARRGELCGLRWSDLALDTGAWRVDRARVTNGSATVIDSEPKTAAGRRIIALDDVTVAALRQHRKLQLEDRVALGDWPDHDFVFTDSVGEPVHPDRMSDRFRRLVRDSELPTMSLHGLRHSAASLLMSAGENPEIVRQRLGHEKVTTTLMMYTHAMPDDMQRGADRLAAMIEGGS